MAAALTVLLFSAGHASAQDALTVGQPLTRAIVAGAAHEYTIALEAGDYVAGAVDQRGIMVLAAVFAPEGRACGISAGLAKASGRSRSSPNAPARIGSSCVRRR
jgi:hypothetical protein